MRATFTGWHDRVIAALLLLAALAVVRAWFADHPWKVAAWAALAAGGMMGIAAGRLVATRLAFHTFDGILAADALHPQGRRGYRARWHAVGLALLTMVTLIAYPSLIIVGAPAYLAGALLAAVTGGGMPRTLTTVPRLGRTFGAWAHRPTTGVAASMILLLSLLPARSISTNAPLVVVGIETALLGLVLTMVDAATIRFMVIAGYGARRIIIHHGGGVATFLALAIPGCWIVLDPTVAGIVAAAGVAMLLFMTLRILAYRFHAKQFADLVVSILAALLLLVAYSIPVALPVIVLAVIWHLQRRGHAKTWLLD